MTTTTENDDTTAIKNLLCQLVGRVEWKISLMLAINERPHSTQADLARHLKWTNKNGGLFKARVSRVVKDLEKQKLIKKARTYIRLTGKGEKLIKI